MQATKIELGQNYSTGKIDFRATALVTIKTKQTSTSYVRGVQIKPATDEIVNVEFEVKNVLNTVEERDRLEKEKAERVAAAEAAEKARVEKKHKAARLLAQAIGVTFDAKHDYKLKGPKVEVSYTSVDVNEEALDALITFLESVHV